MVVVILGFVADLFIQGVASLFIILSVILSISSNFLFSHILDLRSICAGETDSYLPGAAVPRLGAAVPHLGRQPAKSFVVCVLQDYSPPL